MAQTRGQNQTDYVNQQISDPNSLHEVEFATNSKTSSPIHTHMFIYINILMTALCIIVGTYFYAPEYMMEFLSLCLGISIVVTSALSIVSRLTNKIALEHQIFGFLNANPILTIIWLIATIIMFLMILLSPNKLFTPATSMVIQESYLEAEEVSEKEIVPDCNVTVTPHIGANLRSVPRDDWNDRVDTVQRHQIIRVDRYTVNHRGETWYRLYTETGDNQLWIAATVVSLEAICECLAYLKTPYSRTQPD